MDIVPQLRGLSTAFFRFLVRTHVSLCFEHVRYILTNITLDQRPRPASSYKESASFSQRAHSQSQALQRESNKMGVKRYDMIAIMVFMELLWETSSIRSSRHKGSGRFSAPFFRVLFGILILSPRFLSSMQTVWTFRCIVEVWLAGVDSTFFSSRLEKTSTSWIVNSCIKGLARLVFKANGLYVFNGVACR